MSSINISSILVVLFLIGVFLVFALFTNFYCFTNTLIGSCFKNRSSFRRTLKSILEGIQSTLLKFSGASNADVKSNNYQFLKAGELKDTYFLAHKARCIWQLFSYYMFYCFLLVFLAKPIDPMSVTSAGDSFIAFAVHKNAPLQVMNIIILAITNVLTDIASLAFTFVHLNQISKNIRCKYYIKAMCWALKDICVASCFFLLAQIISNNIYPYAIENPPATFNPWTIEAALMPYAFIQGVSDSGELIYLPFTFPGQLLISGTIFLPTIVAMLLIIIYTGLFLFTGLLVRSRMNHSTGESNNDENGELKSHMQFAIKWSMNIVTGTISAVLAGVILYLLGIYN